MSFEFQRNLFGNNAQPELSWHQRYRKVLGSTRWKLLRERLIRERDGCEKCGSTKDIELHHLTYERLGFELDSDLEVLCSTCHRVADARRENRVAQLREKRRSDALYDARMSGYAVKKYGEDWFLSRDASEVSEEFDEWVERRDY